MLCDGAQLQETVMSKAVLSATSNSGCRYFVFKRRPDVHVHVGPAAVKRQFCGLYDATVATGAACDLRV
jgi:hypothetical protein